MSKLSELIAKLCPDGVEYLQVQEVVNIKPGRDYKHLQSGNIPVYGSGGIMTYVDEFSYNRPTVLLPRKGSISNVFYVDEPFWNVDTIYYTEIDETKIMSRFFYHVMCHEHIEKLNTSNAARPALTREVLNKIKIPVPPLEVQREIVRILDTFAETTKELAEKLNAELIARRKQYEYYRDLLFSNIDDNYFKTIRDIVKDSFWIMPKTPRYIKEIGIPYITSKNLHNGNIDFENIKYITKDDYLSISKSRPLQENDILISMIGTLGEIAIIKKEMLPFYGQNMFLLRLNETKILNRYFYLFFNTDNIKNSLMVIKNRSSQGYLKAEQITNIPIPVPPLSEQRRIVSILDRFDALCHDISAGLPAEIAARKKQYEYYRDKLLTFEEKTA